MKKFLFFFLLLMCVPRASAADVSLATARATAVGFMQANAGGKFNLPASGVKLLHAEVNSNLVEKSVYYIFDAGQSFVIVSGDDRAPQILGWGDHPLDMNTMPDNMRFWLENYKEQIEYLQAHPGLTIQLPANRLNTPNITPLLTAHWAQQKPYYNQCPMYDGKYCVTGCPATSLSMVFYYWNYPTDPTPPVEGYMNPSDDYAFEIPALPSITFDWANMRDVYSGDNYTTAQADAVAWLMRYIGQVEQLQYTPSGTGGKGEDVIRAVNFFGYDERAELVYKSKMDVNKNDSLLIEDDEWHAMLQNELMQGRPVVYCGYHREWIGWYGHAFNVDGYKASDNTYHVNWGSGGNGDGYFVLNSFIPPFGTNYNVEQQMIMGIEPPPTTKTIKALRDMVYLKSIVGNTATGTFTVKGYQLSRDVTLTLNDPTGYFSIDATTVPASELENGKVITVTYNPQDDGDHTATITLSSSGVLSRTVALIGKAEIDKRNAFLLPADSSFINLTAFRADWTDETPDENVESYTLRVYTRPDVELIDYIDQRDYPTTYAAAITLSEPWGGINVSVGGKAIYFANWDGMADYGFDGYITYTIPYGFPDQTFSVQITSVDWSSNFGDGVISVGSDQTASVEQSFDMGDTRTWLVTAHSGETIIIDSPDLGHSPYMDNIKIYAGDVTQSSGTVPDNAVDRLIPDITEKFYTVNNLPEAGTYVYKVKALYADGTESPWSNRQTVTLFAGSHNYAIGDVDHNGIVNIKDVTDLIDYLLSQNNEICTICADVTGNGVITIADVTLLIDILLGN